MKKAIMILKINALALVGIPLLLLATCFKLVAKALEKLALFLGMAFVALIASLIVHAVASNPENLLKAIGWIIAICVMGGIVVVIVLWVFSLISGFASVAWTLLIAVFDHLYDLTYTGYLHLFTACESDYRLLSLNGKKVTNALLCLFFTILRGLSWLIVTIVSIALPLAIIASVLLVITTLWDLNSNVKHAFGLNLIQYLGKCSGGQIIGGILLYLVFAGLIITALMALALEWYEWAQELKMTDREISDEIGNVIDSKLRIASGTAEEVERNKAYFDKVQEHMNGLDDLGRQVTELLGQKDNSLLRSYWGVYMRNLSPIVEECSREKGITNDQFKQLVPQIQLLDKQRGDVQKLLEKLASELKNPAGSSTFFVGCDTSEKLEKRYRSLCKTYHPDEMGGDTTTFQKMKQEYETIKAAMPGSAETKKAEAK